MLLLYLLPVAADELPPLSRVHPGDEAHALRFVHSFHDGLRSSAVEHARGQTSVANAESNAVVAELGGCWTLTLKLLVNAVDGGGQLRLQARGVIYCERPREARERAFYCNLERRRRRSEDVRCLGPAHSDECPSLRPSVRPGYQMPCFLRGAGVLLFQNYSYETHTMHSTVSQYIQNCCYARTQ